MTLVPTVSPMSYRNAETFSIERLDRHFPKCLKVPQAIDVLETWEILHDVYGFELSICELPDGIEGRTWPTRLVELSSNTYEGACNDEPRPRFTVVHECKHAWHHADQIQRVLESAGTLRLNRRSEIETFRDPEWQANALTGAYLMPLPALRILREKGQLNISTVEDVFNVSKQAAKIRLELVERKNFV